MERLKLRLKMVNVTSQSVCNCHGDSQLLEVIHFCQSFSLFSVVNSYLRITDTSDVARWLHLHQQTSL